LREALDLLVAQAGPPSSSNTLFPELAAEPVAKPVDHPALPGPTSHSGARTLRVEVTKLDRMIDMMGELAIARGRLCALFARAAARGTATLAEDPRGEAARLIFEPGLSTSPAVTELSGRGIGMDVIRRGVEALRGSVAVESRDGQGTTFTLRIPLTLATIDG